MPTDGQKHSASGRLHRIGVIFFNETSPEHVMERLLTDYAVVGGPPLSELIKRAKVRLQKMEEE